MPCSDGNSIHAEYQEKLMRERSRAARAEAVACALLNELRRVHGKDTDKIIQRAGESGKVDVFAFREDHMSADRQRLHIDILQRYSNDELAVISRILKDLEAEDD